MTSRRMHEGRVPQPGVPSGPRNTPKKTVRKKEVAGPYRSQSSVPSVRAQATPHEHRRVSIEPTSTRDTSSGSRSDVFDVPTIHAPTKAERRRSRIEKAMVGKIAATHLRPDPGTALMNARNHGIAPPESLKHEYGEKAFHAAEKAQQAYVAAREGIHADPFAELAISTAATAGIGGLAGAAEKVVGPRIASGVARVAAPETSVGEMAAEKAAKVATKIKSAPKSVAGGAVKKVRKVKAAPGSAVKTAKRAPELKTKAGQEAAVKAAGRTARKHPVRTGYGAAAASPVPLPGDADKRARAFAEGTAAALVNHPGKTLETTAHGVLGFLTAPVAVAGAGVSSVKQGSPAPLVDEGSTLLKGTKKMVGNLASGDPKQVERTTLQETGLTPFLPVPHLLKRAKGTKLYEDSIRGKVRETVEGKRAKTRVRRTAAEKTATESGEFVGRKRARKVRQSVEDSARPGERYALRRTGKLIEKQRSRHHVAREATRMQEEGEFASKQVSERVAKALRKSKLSNQKEQNVGEALRIFVKHGLPTDQVGGMALVKRIHDGYSKVEHGDIPAGVHLDRHSTQWILDHPEVFKDKHFWEAVKRFDQQAEGVGTSERNRYLAQVQNVINPIRKEEGKLPILLPEEDIPASTAAILKTAVPKRTDRWSRDEALNYAKDLAEVKGASRGRALATRQALLDSLDGLMRSPKHGGAAGGVSTTRAVAWTPEMEQRFAREVVAEHPRLDLRKPAAYVADVVPSGLKGADKAPDFAAELPLRKIWPSRGKAAMSGNAESGFESLMHHSAGAPRARAAMVAGLNRIFDRASREVSGKRYLTRAEVEHAINARQVPDGTIFVRTQALKSLLEGEHHVNPEEFHRQLMAEVEHGQQLAAKDQLAGEMEAVQASGVKGEKFAPMDAAAIHELMGHMEPLGRATRWAAKGTNLATRVILNSPAFAAIQIPQEGLPLAAALGRNVVDLPKAIASLRQVGKLDPELQAQIKATVGSSAGVLGAPSTKALKSEGYMNPIRAAGTYPKWRHVWDLANGNVIGRFDRARAGRFRETAAMAKINGDLRRAEKGFNVWRSSASNLFKHEQAAVKAMKGMNSAERAAYVSEHPRLGDQLMKDLNGMAGNFNSFTVFEKHLAPFTIFYPFQRYSVLWMLYHFPLDHPVVATGLTLLGQVNAAELERLAAKKGATPDILDYTMPVVQNGKGNAPTVLPAGQRTFPGLSTVQQAAIAGKPGQLIGELSPALQIAVSAAEGKDSYTGQPLGENGWEYAARSVLALSPLARFLGLPETGQEQSVASKAFGEQDPLKKLRSSVDPFIGQTADQYAKTKALSKAFDEKYSNPVPGLPPEIWEAAYNGDWAAARKLRAQVLKSEKGSDLVKAAESPYFKDGGGKLSDEGSKILQYITGVIQIPAKSKPTNQFGIPSTSTSALRKQFGLPDTSTAKLKEEFGIE